MIKSALQRPLYLFADSELLFFKNDGRLFLHSLRNLMDKDRPVAAYIGVSNGDALEFYQLFQAAMAAIDIKNCGRVTASFSSRERAIMEAADLICLAGGDIKRGWNILQSTGMDKLLMKKYDSGAIVIGLSAGAIQLGVSAFTSEAILGEGLFETLGLVPFIISVHDEKADWNTLKLLVSAGKCNVKGIGIPKGGGMIYHQNRIVEPLRYSLHLFSDEGAHLHHKVLPVCDGLNLSGNARYTV